jgi:D-3-phosphoglycerate dehydrogenase
VTAAFTAGLLECWLAQGVTIVNAELLARERGIEIVGHLRPKKAISVP